mgnify:CR=1 FL=1
MVVFDSADIYILGAPTMCEQLARIEAVINALYATAIKAAANGNISEYSLDDGQTKIRTVYKDASSVQASILAFERLKQDLINKIKKCKKCMLLLLLLLFA